MSMRPAVELPLYCRNQHPAEATYSLLSASTGKQLVALKPLERRFQLWVSGVPCCYAHTINAPRIINGVVLLFLGIIVVINN
jgi:hypothetical protein